MLAIFCVRLALGLVLFLPLIWNCSPHARFVRTQFLTALGLLVVAIASDWNDADGWLRGLSLSGAGLALAGAWSWTLDPPPAGKFLSLSFIAVTLATLLLRTISVVDGSIGNVALQMANETSSAAFLGAAMTAMLVGHSYLISPGLSMTPLMRLLIALFGCIGARVAVAAIAMVWWITSSDRSNDAAEVWLWLPVRWLVGILAPLVFGLMAYSAAKIRSTQSATGILYVATVCAILGELVGVLLMRQTGLPL